MHHLREDEMVEGQHCEPIEPPEKTAGAEGRGLDDAPGLVDRSIPIWLDLEFQPRVAGQLHLGVENEPSPHPVRRENPPEIERIARVQLTGMTPSPPQS